MSKPEIGNDLTIAIPEFLPVGIFLVENLTGEIFYSNPKAENIFGYSKDGPLGLVIEDLIPQRYRKSHTSLRKNYIDRPKGIAMSNGRVLTGLKKDGQEVLLQIGITPFNDKYTLLSLVETTNDIIKPSASNDPLTGLLNRNLFYELSEKLRQLAVRNKNSISIAFIDLNNFKPVNDRYGHHIGDEVICEVASQLKKHVRSSDLIGRMGGDEFIMCLYGMEDGIQLKHYLDRLINHISSINNIKGNPINIGASIGATFTLYPKNKTIFEMAIIADELMYKAKNEDKGIAIISELNDFN